jgi:hypothetical protein
MTKKKIMLMDLNIYLQQLVGGHLNYWIIETVDLFSQKQGEEFGTNRKNTSSDIIVGSRGILDGCR